MPHLLLISCEELQGGLKLLLLALRGPQCCLLTLQDRNGVRRMLGDLSIACTYICCNE